MSMNSQRIVFDPEVSYESYLNTESKEFDEKWENHQSSPNIGITGYEILQETIGTGSFGVVKVVKNVKTNDLIAVKIMSKKKAASSADRILCEKNVMKCSNFPFIMRLLFTRKDINNLYLAMPLISTGTLYDLLKLKHRLNEAHTRFYAMQVFLCLEYLHHMNILYRDIKPENILLESDGYILLTDFGCCKRIWSTTDSYVGTVQYMAPEVLNKQSYSKSCDWWSFGILLYEMITGETPYNEDPVDLPQLKQRFEAGNFEVTCRSTEDFRNLIASLLTVEIKDRIGCSESKGCQEIKEHLWFKKQNWYEILNKTVEAPYIPEKVDSIKDVCQNYLDASQLKIDHPTYGTVFEDF